MPAQTTLAHLSDSSLFLAVLLYAVAMLAFAADAAGVRSRRAVRPAELAVEAPVLVGAGGPAVVEAPPFVASPPHAPPAPGGKGGGTRSGLARARASLGRGVGPAAVTLTAAGALVHLGSVASRGLAAGRVPWGNMYEFSSVVALVAVTAFLVLLAKRRVDRSVGPFVMLPVVCYLGLAGTVLYTKVGPLLPALDSYWIKIHVAAAILASGAFMLSGVLALLYLLRARFEAAAGSPAFPLSLGRTLPRAEGLDRATYAVIAFAFPVWTFAIIAGAIWAESAWGRYWGWDPKETWSFITWVLYAGYLHARSTAGWKGRKAAWVAVAAAVALVIDYYVVNIFIVGFHSYSGLK